MIMDKTSVSLSLLTAVVTGVCTLAIIPSQLMGQPAPAPSSPESPDIPLRTISRIEFIPPGEGRPRDSWGGGTHVWEPEQTREAIPTAELLQCPQDEQPDTEITPQQQLHLLQPPLYLQPDTPDSETVSPLRGGFTVASHPTFFVYIPPTSRQYLEFALTNNSYDYAAVFQISNTPGIIQITLPPDAPPLEIGEEYYWQLAIICNYPDHSGVVVWEQGKIKRVAPSDELATALATATPLEQAALYAQKWGKSYRG